MEVLETVRKYKYNEKPFTDYFELPMYENIRGYSKEISKLKYVLKVFEPDYIIILNWDNTIEDWLLEGLDYTWNEEEYIDNKISTYKISKYKTKIIWCPHPNRWRYLKIDINDIGNQIKKRMQFS